MKIAIIGAKGFLGKKLVEYFSKDNEVVSASLHPSEGIIKLDATKEKEVDFFMSKFKPEIVIDTVALASSVACEKNLLLCKKLNYLTAKNIAKACKKNNSLMVFISSSYVFKGNKGDYKEDDILSPSNEYAKTKAMAEKEVSKLDNYLIIRVDMMYGKDNGKIRFGTHILNGELIEVGFPKQIRTPILINDVPRVIYELIKKKEKGIFHVAGPDKVSLIDFLRRLSELENSSTKIKVVDSSRWLVKSPKNTSLDISKIKSLNIKTTSIKVVLKKIKSQI